MKAELGYKAVNLDRKINDYEEALKILKEKDRSFVRKIEFIVSSVSDDNIRTSPPLFLQKYFNRVLKNIEKKIIAEQKRLRSELAKLWSPFTST